jgi:hypothetical protein
VLAQDVLGPNRANAVGYLMGPPAAAWITTRFSLLISALMVGALLVVVSAAGLMIPTGGDPRNRGP